MTLLIRLATAGAFIGMLLVGSMWLPPFPAEFEEWLTVFFTRMLVLDHWLPVKLTLSLLVVRMGVEAAVYLWKFGKWFKAFLMGESPT